MSWERVTLGNISANIQTGPFGSQLHQYDYSETGTPVVMPKDLADGKISEQSIARVSDEHVQRLNRHIIQKGDILYSRRGDVGRCAFATEHEKGWLCGTGCLRVTTDASIADSKFIFYQLQQPEVVGWVEKHAVGSTMLNLNTTILSNIPLLLPPIETQHRIADILSVYDDLIENNRKQIKLLEEAAQRLYKEWFVDLRFPGHEHTKIVDGVPEGWERKPIDDVFIVKYGKTLPTSKITKSGAYPVYGANGVIGFYKEKNCDEYITVITSRGNGSGDVLRTYHKEAFITNNSFTVIPIREYDYCKVQYTYYLMKSLNFKSICTGSAQPQLTNSSISTLILILPAKEIINVFCDMAEPFFYKINILMEQIERITQARDRLLPKLMSGEVEV